MKLAYAIDHEQKIIEYDPEFEKMLPDLNYKRIPISGTTQSSEKYKLPQLLINITNIDMAKLSEQEWAGTHPNGLLYSHCFPFFTSNGSVGFVFKKYGITAWHVVMTLSCKEKEMFNIPTIGYFDNLVWRVNVYTRPVVLVNVNRFMGEYEIGIIESNKMYKYNYTSVLGKEVCAYGTLSATSPKHTYASYLPSIIPVPLGCPKLRSGDIVTIASAVSGIRDAEVISTNVETAYMLKPNYILVFQKMFKLSVPSLPGDSGGAVYVTI
jgi:hypothetical protein